jgi:hypothetical protein
MDIDEMDAYLEHYGVRGMKWGVKRAQSYSPGPAGRVLQRTAKKIGASDTPGVSKRTDREAKKDAQETARAQMYYGQGAGTRRKLINKSVEAKKTRDPKYAKAFDNHMSKQDMSTHASKARKERSSTDRKIKNKQRAGAVARKFTGEMGTQAAFTAAALAGAAYMSSPKARSFVKQSYKSAEAVVKQKRGAAALNKLFKNMA